MIARNFYQKGSINAVLPQKTGVFILSKGKWSYGQ